MKLQIVLDDPETRAVWRTAQQARDEVASWPAWKRGESEVCARPNFMGAHIVNDQFQSDKYPSCPPGKVPLSVKDPTAQDLLWEYAQRRRVVDSEFSDDLEACLLAEGYQPKK